jgi:hypothetical protein
MLFSRETRHKEKEKSKKTEKSAREEREKSRVFACTVLIRACAGPLRRIEAHGRHDVRDHLAVLVVHKYDSTPR